MKEKIISIIETKTEKIGKYKNDEVGDYFVISKETLMKRLNEITQNNSNYTIIISEK